MGWRCGCLNADSIPCLDPVAAFRLFTEKVDEWWPPERRHSDDPASRIFLLESGRFYERTGDGNTPNNTRYDPDFKQIHGATYRHLFDLADWDKGLATSAPGQSGQEKVHPSASSP